MSSAVSELDAQSSSPAPDAALVAAITDLHVTFRRNGRDVRALRGVSLDITPGEILGLVGESGSGKSVLGFTMLGLLPQARVQGSVTVAGNDMVTGDAKILRKVRRLDLGAVFQDPMTSLNPTMRIGKQVAEAAGSDEEALKLLTAVGIPEPKRRFRAFPHELSGGLRQRVMIAIAIAGNPELIIADEPTTALDVTVQAQVLRLLQRLRAEIGCSIVLITHDLGVAAQISDRIAVLYAGRIAEIGPTAEVLGRPAHPYTHGLLRSRLTLETARHRKLAALAGAVPSAVDPLPGCAFAPRCVVSTAACEATSRPDRDCHRPRQRLHRALRSGVHRARLAPDHHHRAHRAGSRGHRDVPAAGGGAARDGQILRQTSSTARHFADRGPRRIGCLGRRERIGKIHVASGDRGP
jgi:peptide/nickel transport system ATP-binding protein